MDTSYIYLGYLGFSSFIDFIDITVLIIKSKESNILREDFNLSVHFGDVTDEQLVVFV